MIDECVSKIKSRRSKNTGKQCGRLTKNGTRHCGLHSILNTRVNCSGTTKRNKRCTVPVKKQGLFCRHHKINAGPRNGDSLTNGHGVVIPRLPYEYITYMPKDIIIEIRGRLKKTFPRETANRDFFNVDIEEINNFILYFCVTRNVKYTQVDPKLLGEYNDSL